MAWNPFRVIGDAIGRVFGRSEQPASPEPPPAAPEPSPPAAVPERRGGLAGLWDRVSGADRRQEEADRERQLEERLRQLEERERQLVERERQIEVREQAAAPAQAPAPEQAAPPAPTAPERDLPKFATDASDFLVRDERAFGTDSELGRELDSAVADFIADRGGLDGLSVDAREWLQTPTISEPFSNYWQSGGFSVDQVLAGMTNIRNIQITEGDDGEVHVEFDYDAEVDGYEVHGHASS